jgi:hypothetical protein
VSVQFPSQSTSDYTRVDYRNLPDCDPPLQPVYDHIIYGNNLYKRVTNINPNHSPATALVLKTKMQNLPSVSSTSSNIKLTGVCKETSGNTLDTTSEKRGRKPKDRSGYQCYQCKVTETPQWRYGPTGPNTLCNACGLTYSKDLNNAKEQNDKGNLHYLLNPLSKRTTKTNI